MNAKDNELQRLIDENAKLKQSQQAAFTPDYFMSNGEYDNAKVKYYTGLTNFLVLMSLFRFLEPKISHSSKSLLSKFQKLILVMIKLRLSLTMQDLSYRFNISLTTASHISKHDWCYAYILKTFDMLAWTGRINKNNANVFSN